MMTDADPSGGPPNKRANTKRWGGVNSLGQMAKMGMWPTPKASDPKVDVDDTGEYARRATTYLSLPVAVKLWPTPTERDWRSGKNKSCWENSRPLSEMVERWPTPRANPAMAATITEGADPDRYPNLETVVKKRDPGVVGGQLNPMWVEWLMGLPIGWTGSEPLATVSYQQWWQSSCGEF
jgi:hypothetical protein